MNQYYFCKIVPDISGELQYAMTDVQTGEKTKHQANRNCNSTPMPTKIAYKGIMKRNNEY